MTKKKSKRLVQGRDFHGWAWKADDWHVDGRSCIFNWAEPYRPKLRQGSPTEKGRYVRVKFVEVSNE
jgi:hypothetical protein